MSAPASAPTRWRWAKTNTASAGIIDTAVKANTAGRPHQRELGRPLAAVPVDLWLRGSLELRGPQRAVGADRVLTTPVRIPGG